MIISFTIKIKKNEIQKKQGAVPWRPQRQKPRQRTQKNPFNKRIRGSKGRNQIITHKPVGKNQRALKNHQVMANKMLFNSVEGPRVPKSVHDLTHELKISCNTGELIPITWVDVLPNTKVRIGNEALVRMMPMTAPIFDRLNVTFHRYFVPKRLLWDHWDEYVSLTKIGIPAALPIHPYVELDPNSMDYTNPANSPLIRLRNYMGIPYQYDSSIQTESTHINPLRWAAYQFIYNEYYRDQQLIPEIVYKCVDGNNTARWNTLSTLRKRAWKHDYFTSGLPQPQKGDSVLMPVILNDAIVKIDATAYPTGVQLDNLTGADLNVLPATPNVTTTGELFADLTAAAPTTTLSDFRYANAIQRFKERLNRIGSGRFTEYLKGVFNIKSRDSRLQRPELFGGDIKPVTISEVLQTSQPVPGGDSPTGNMAGHGATYINGNQSHFFAEEHGYIITIMNIQPDGHYFQGLDKDMLKINHPTEIYVPDTANLGEQATQRQELYAYTVLREETFNYVPRWSEHRFISDRVAGQLAQASLLHWHCSRYFTTEPNYNQAFIEADQVGSTDRIFAVTDPDEEKLLVQIENNIQVVAPIPKNGTPSI